MHKVKNNEMWNLLSFIEYSVTSYMFQKYKQLAATHPLYGNGILNLYKFSFPKKIFNDPHLSVIHMIGLQERNTHTQTAAYILPIADILKKIKSL